MAQAAVALRSLSGGQIELTPRGDLPPNFWSRLRDEFPEPGRRGSDAIRIPMERLLSSRYILRATCQQYRVALDVDDQVRALLVGAEQDRLRLDGILKDPPRLAEAAVEAGLVGGRFRRQLTPFQVENLRVLLALPHGANFSVPGAGKTTTAYAAYEFERMAGRVLQLLVISPLAAFEAWEGEAGECFAPPPIVHRFDGGDIPSDVEVLLVGYQRLSTSYSMVSNWAARRTTHVILDEAHRMKKGREGAWGSACLDLSYTAARRDILTGTPAPQSPADLEVLLDFLWPTLGRTLVPQQARRVDAPPAVTSQVARRIAPLFVRTAKRQLELPPVIHAVEKIRLTGLHREIYDGLRDRFSGIFATSRREQLDLIAMGRVVMYLLEAATNPALLVAGGSPDDPIAFRHPPLDVPVDSGLFDLLRQYPSYETPLKFARLAELVSANARDGRKTLVWTNFVRNLTTLQRELRGLSPAVVHGGVPVAGPGGKRPREAELNRFRHDPKCWVLLANPASIGEGISLHHACHDAVYLDRTFNAGQYLQSVDRIHRLGLSPDEETRITSLITEDTIDEVVDRRVRTKAGTLGQLLDDPDIVTMALPDEEDYGPAIEPGDDLTALLEHLQAGGGVHGPA